jgi:protein-L-isoaspartate O-methyltransferase
LISSYSLVLLQFVVGDGRVGYESSAPYDIIHVGAALPEALLSKLLQQAVPPPFLPNGFSQSAQA